MAKKRKEEPETLAMGSDEVAVAPAMGMPAQSPPPAALGGWAQLLRERREAAGFSKPELARRSGLSMGTIKRIESGHVPSRDTLLRLAAVPELNLGPEGSSAWMGLEELDPGFRPNCWIADGFSALDSWHEMIREVNGHGGHIDQTHLYLDHSSAVGWHALATQESYAPARRAMPLEKAAAEVLDSVGTVGLEVIALGPGDGIDEVRLVQHLLDDKRHRDVRLFLVDISQPLLHAAFKHAKERLVDHKWVSVLAVHGNFHHLSRYSPLVHQPQRSHRRRLVTMLGNTFANLLNEPLFIRNNLTAFGSGDLLLLSVPLACAPADRPDEIRKKDPRLAGTGPASLSFLEGSAFHDFITGPLRRYVKDVRKVTIETELDVAACPVPGSYAAMVKASVTVARGEPRTFTLLYIKRYDEAKFVECFRQQGWDPVKGWHFGTGHPSLLYLFRKR